MAHFGGGGRSGREVQSRSKPKAREAESLEPAGGCKPVAGGYSAAEDGYAHVRASSGKRRFAIEGWEILVETREKNLCAPPGKWGELGQGLNLGTGGTGCKSGRWADLPLPSLLYTSVRLLTLELQIAKSARLASCHGMGQKFISSTSSEAGKMDSGQVGGFQPQESLIRSGTSDQTSRIRSR